MTNSSARAGSLFDLGYFNNMKAFNISLKNLKADIGGTLIEAYNKNNIDLTSILANKSIGTYIHL